jgi:hypothetical protein
MLLLIIISRYKYLNATFKNFVLSFSKHILKGIFFLSIKIEGSTIDIVNITEILMCNMSCWNRLDAIQGKYHMNGTGDVIMLNKI